MWDYMSKPILHVLTTLSYVSREDFSSISVRRLYFKNMFGILEFSDVRRF